MSIYHKHHIIPKHMGGTDDPSNLIELTIEEHAEAHRKLFEQYGHWQDELAWKGLSKMIDKEQIIKQIQIRCAMESSIRNSGKIPWNKGLHGTQKHTKKWKDQHSLIMKGRKLSDNHKSKIGNSMKNKEQKKVQCPHCQSIGGISNMKRFHFDNCKLIQNQG